MTEELFKNLTRPPGASPRSVSDPAASIACISATTCKKKYTVTCISVRLLIYEGLIIVRLLIYEGLIIVRLMHEGLIIVMLMIYEGFSIIR